MRLKLFTAFLILTLFFPFFIVDAHSQSEYVIDGDTVYIDDENVYIAVYPHTSSGGWVYLNFTSKQYSGNLDFLLGFSSDNGNPVKAEYYNPHVKPELHEYVIPDFYFTNSSFYFFNYTYGYEDDDYFYEGTIWFWEYDSGNWVLEGEYDFLRLDKFFYSFLYYHFFDVTWVALTKDRLDWKRINYEYQGMDRWYYFSRNVNEDQLYHIRIWLDVLPSLTGSTNKFWFAVKRSDQTLQEAISLNQFYFIDPWWDNSWGYCKGHVINHTYTAGGDSSEEWLSPSSFLDPSAEWVDEGNAYDGNTGTGAYSDIGGETWSDWLYLNFTECTGTKVRTWIEIESGNIDNMNLDILNTSDTTWYTVLSGDPAGIVDAWYNVTFTSTTSDCMRYQFYNSHHSQNRMAYVMETDFLNVTEGGGSGSLADINYTMRFDVNYGAGSDSGESVYCNSHCQADFDDIRFLQDDNSTLYSYWIEEFTASDDATFWVRIDDNLTSTDVTLFMYYGNGGASSVSDGSATFVDFDNFEDDDFSEWTMQGTVSKDGTHSQSGSYSAYQAGSAGNRLDKTGLSYTSHSINLWIYESLDDEGNFLMTENEASVLRGIGIEDDIDSTYVEYRLASTYYDTSQTQSTGWYKLEVRCDGTDFEGLVNDVSEFSGQSGTSITLVTIGNSWPAATSATWFDSFYIRKYVSPEPSHGSWGDEETAPIGNNAPTNDTCIFTDLDDTDDLYAQKQNYTILYNVTDLDGYADIDYCEVRLKQAAVTRAIFRYDEDTNTFSVESGGTEWNLNASSSATESGDTLNITLIISAQWDATEEADLEIEAYIVDDEPESDTDTMQTDYFDVITNLVTNSIECTDANDPDRVDISSSIQIDFSVRYVTEPSGGTASSYYPPDAEFTSISVYDTGDNNKGTDSSIVNGAGSVTFNSESSVTSMNYNLYIDMVDADYTDGEETATETVISDRITFLYDSLEVTDSRIDYDQDGEWYAKLKYEYDDAEVTDGTVSLNTGSMSYDVGDGRWEYTFGLGSVGDASRNIASVSGNTYGITALNSAVTSDSETIIYDRIEIVSVAFNDSRVNIGDPVEVRYVLRYDYDDDAFDGGDGSLVGFTWDAGNGWWEKDVNAPASPSSENYDENDLGALTDTTYGLTLIEDDAGSDLIGDRITFLTGTLEVVDGRINYDDDGQWYCELKYEYDDAEVNDGTVTLDVGSMTWEATDDRWEYNFSLGAVGDTSREIDSVDLNTYGITALNVAVTGDSETIIFDEIAFLSGTLEVTDARIDYDVNGEWYAQLKYEYDDTALTDGSVNLNTGSMSYDGGDSRWEYVYGLGSVGLESRNIASASGNTYGISKLNAAVTGDSEDIIYDQLDFIYIADDTGDQRIDVSSNFEVRYNITYDYDDVLFDNTKGSIAGFAWDGVNAWWDKTVTGSASVTSTNYDETYVSVTDSTYDLTKKKDVAGINIITDRIKILSITVNESNPLVNEYVELRVTAELEYDSHAIDDGVNDALNLVDATVPTLTWDGGNSWWEVDDVRAVAVAVTYDEVTGSENTYGITVINMNGKSVIVTWVAGEQYYLTVYFTQGLIFYVNDTSLTNGSENGYAENCTLQLNGTAENTNWEFFGFERVTYNNWTQDNPIHIDFVANETVWAYSQIEGEPLLYESVWIFSLIWVCLVGFSLFKPNMLLKGGAVMVGFILALTIYANVTGLGSLFGWVVVIINCGLLVSVLFDR